MLLGAWMISLELPPLYRLLHHLPVPSVALSPLLAAVEEAEDLELVVEVDEEDLDRLQQLGYFALALPLFAPRWQEVSLRLWEQMDFEMQGMVT